ncbi:hypothetical protein BU23DRAFT_657180 [Bimuria novae-zelandiae CBS 107.79]|uniref:Uncharacterized protein n=1 Tax=Bimuria novae-zelandiae CBS 107.79 TaxID=1447943 RepID=A0A6A5VPX7_9PLEO|nr:hypothetical protein BU23DRAFT_657180 [Bimuria novae-zelandiae CBS 107.79]
MIGTENGDLILSPSHANKIYLQGLCLPHGSASGKRFKCGYNLRHGETDRDRQSLGDANGEASTIIKIWAGALRTSHHHEEILTRYTNLLMKCLNKVADVMILGDTHLDADVALMVWHHMLKLGRERHGTDVFYYCLSKNGNDMETIIQKNVRLHAVPITPDLWDLLSEHQLCRTPMEEQHHRLATARRISTLTDPFAQHVAWFLKFCFASDKSTRKIKWQFVEGSYIDIDVAWVEDKIIIHDKYINNVQAYEGSFQHEALSPFSESYAYNVVLWLWDLVLAQLVSSGQHPETIKKESWLKVMVRTQLGRNPRAVTSYPAGDQGGPLVDWHPGPSYNDDGADFMAILHEDDCAFRPMPTVLPWPSGDDVSQMVHDFGKLKFLDYNPNHTNHNSEDIEERPCACPSTDSHSAHCRTTFSNLSLDKAYIPEVRIGVAGSFPALPPPAAMGPSLEDALSSREASPQVLSSPAGSERDIHRETPSGTLSPRNSVSKHVEGSAIQDRIVIDPNSDSESALAAYTGRNASGVSLAPLKHYLGWAEGFPGSHDFYRTRNNPASGILIARKKAETFRHGLKNKRARDSEPSSSNPPKAKRSRRTYEMGN